MFDLRALLVFGLLGAAVSVFGVNVCTSSTASDQEEDVVTPERESTDQHTTMAVANVATSSIGPELSEEVRAKIETAARALHPGNSLLQKREINVQSQAYQKLLAFRRHDDVPATVLEEILSIAGERHVEDYVSQLRYVTEQIEALRNLVVFQLPPDIPKHVLGNIVKEAADLHADDYAQQLEMIKAGISSYRLGEK